ncbi:hypothetical protein, partial [Microbispora bryophytorum]|uniref:hypothetical protein n=1 Tax=Microbispora bryophytorum TaxID=1460882 RepID=UPI0033C15698
MRHTAPYGVSARPPCGPPGGCSYRTAGGRAEGDPAGLLTRARSRPPRSHAPRSRLAHPLPLTAQTLDLQLHHIPLPQIRLR